MGAYLSKPIIKKETEVGEGNSLGYAASSMQGWRVSQEDAHNCLLDLDDKTSLFAVYDGHGGAEVAIYLSRHFAEVLKSTQEYKSGIFDRALHESYVKIDAKIKDPEAISEIQRIAKHEAGDDADNVADYEEENVCELYEEATMPIEKLMAKYSAVRAGVESFSKSLSSDNEKPGSSKSLLSTLAAAVSACSSSSSSSSMNQTRTSSIKEEDEELSSSSTPNPITTTSTTSENKSQSFIVDSGECSSSSSSMVPTLRMTSEAVVINNEVDTAEAERITSEDSPPEPPSYQSNDRNNGDVEPSSSTSEGVEGNEVLSVRERIRPPHQSPINGIEENVEPDSTDNEAKAVTTSSIPTLNGSSTTPNDGDKEVVADSTQPENAKISLESPKRKGKIHPQPIVPIPQPTRSSTRRKVNDVKVYKDFFSNQHAGDDDSESDDDDAAGAGGEPFMNDSDSDDDEETGLEEGHEEEESSDDDDDEDDDDDDDDDDEDDAARLADMQEPGYDSGSTAVVALLKWEEGGKSLGLWVANAGDSRCVVCRNGVALEMSHDHKPEEEIEARRIIKAGGKVTNDGRVNGGLNLSRALGDHSYKQNKALPSEEQMITPVPDVRHEVLDPLIDQFVVLACDGVWNSLSSQEVVDFISERLKKNIKISDICEQLFDACLAPDTSGDGTGCDNMTAIIVQLNSKPVVEGESIVSTEESRDCSTKRRLSTQAEAEESKRLKTESD